MTYVASRSSPANTRRFSLSPFGEYLPKNQFANSWNSQIPEPQATRDRYRVRVHFSQTGMGRRLSSNQGVSRDFCRCRLLKCVSSLMDGVSHIALFSDS